MKKKFRRILCLVMVMSISIMSSVTALADRVDADLDTPYLSLGADLTNEQKATVLGLLGLAEADLSQYNVVTVTNEDEHNYLGSYLDASVIGTRALSSVLVVGKESGYGIQVKTQNISYCTTGMYRNALITAGVQDADISVAGPFSISGTAALVGAIKAYEVMTGETVSDDSLDVANNELVVTGEVAESVGDSEKAEELIALVKQEVVAGNITNADDIERLIDEAASELEITLTDEDRDKIAALMEKIKGLNLDVETIKSQAQDLYDRLDALEFDFDLESASNWFTKIIDSVVDFFRNLF